MKIGFWETAASKDMWTQVITDFYTNEKEERHYLELFLKKRNILTNNEKFLNFLLTIHFFDDILGLPKRFCNVWRTQF